MSVVVDTVLVVAGSCRVGCLWQVPTGTGKVVPCGAEQKAALAKAITDAMVDIGKTTPEATIIVFEDVSKDNWAQSGILASEQS